MALGALDALNFNSMIPEKLHKAKIQVLNSRGAVKDSIEVLFNPAQYEIVDSANYTPQRNSWRDNPLLSYAGGISATLNMDLFFDTGPVLTSSVITGSKATDVSKKVRKFADLVYINGKEHAPPRVKFVWGSLSFLGVITQVKSSYTKFTESGMPIQARVHISFCSAPEENAKRKSPFESPDRTKCRVVREDYSIWDIARNEYGDVSKWKIIARANGISNPLDIPPGTMLKVPAL